MNEGTYIFIGFLGGAAIDLIVTFVVIKYLAKRFNKKNESTTSTK